jgi:hypothetical protein
MGGLLALCAVVQALNPIRRQALTFRTIPHWSIIGRWGTRRGDRLGDAFAPTCFGLWGGRTTEEDGGAHSPAFNLTVQNPNQNPYDPHFFCDQNRFRRPPPSRCVETGSRREAARNCQTYRSRRGNAFSPLGPRREQDRKGPRAFISARASAAIRRETSIRLLRQTDAPPILLKLKWQPAVE